MNIRGPKELVFVACLIHGFVTFFDFKVNTGNYLMENSSAKIRRRIQLTTHHKIFKGIDVRLKTLSFSKLLFVKLYKIVMEKRNSPSEIEYLIDEPRGRSII